MTLEKIVLIFALLGSAKVTFDFIIRLFKRPVQAPSDRELLVNALSIADSLSQKNSLLEKENLMLRQRLTSNKS